MKMKKSIKGLMISSIVFSLLAAAIYIVGPVLWNALNNDSITFQNIVDFSFAGFINLFNFSNISVLSIVGLVTLGLMFAIFLVWLIVTIVKKQNKYIASSIVGLFVFVIIYFLLLTYLFSTKGTVEIPLNDNQFLLLYFIDNISTYAFYFANGAIALGFAAFALFFSLIEFVLVLVQPKVVKQELVEGDSKEISNDEVISKEEVEKILNNVSSKEEPVVYNDEPVNKEAIETIVASQISSMQFISEDDVRRIVKEELENYFASKPVTLPAVDEKPVATESEEIVEEKAKIIRIPFETRILTMEPLMRNNFNELKAEILSYGVKSRISNSGDTFRLHTKTYVKMTIAGKSLKLYFALNPEDYKDTTLPIADVSHKGIYKDIPLVFKVKSGLSLRRAKALIADVMAKDNLKQGEIVKKDYIQDIIDSKKQ